MRQYGPDSETAMSTPKAFLIRFSWSRYEVSARRMAISTVREWEGMFIVAGCCFDRLDVLGGGDTIVRVEIGAI